MTRFDRSPGNRTFWGLTLSSFLSLGGHKGPPFWQKVPECIAGAWDILSPAPSVSAQWPPAGGRTSQAGGTGLSDDEGGPGGAFPPSQPRAHPPWGGGIRPRTLASASTAAPARGCTSHRGQRSRAGPSCICSLVFGEPAPAILGCVLGAWTAPARAKDCLLPQRSAGGPCAVIQCSGLARGPHPQIHKGPSTSEGLQIGFLQM